MRTASSSKSYEPWERGLPPGGYYPGMERDFEVYLSPGGWTWYRRITAVQSDQLTATMIDPDGGRP